MTKNALVILDVTEQTVLATCEEVINRGLRTFVEVGNALLTIRDRRLYRAQHDTFEEYCQERWGIARRTTNRLIAAAGVVTNLQLDTSLQMGPMGPICNESPVLPASERQARPLTQLPSDMQPLAWQRAVETAPGGRVTAAHVQVVVDAMRAQPYSESMDGADDDDTEGQPMHVEVYDDFGGQRGYNIGPDEELVVVKTDTIPEWYQSSKSDDWWTPQWLFDLLDSEFRFETDVCASDANHKCGRYFTREQDGLAQEWTGTCWMNPPYGRSGGSSPIGHWIEKAFRSAMDGATVVCLVPARTDTSWWWEFCIHGEVRFLPGRLRFSEADNTATFPSAVVVFWPTVPRGRTVVRWWNIRGERGNGS